jgi:hypothetical protein
VPRLGRHVLGVDLEVRVVGVCGQQVCKRLYGSIEGHAIALVLEQRIQTAQHQRCPPRCQQHPGGVLLSGQNVLLRALLVEGGHTVWFYTAMDSKNGSMVRFWPALRFTNAQVPLGTLM